MTRISACSSLYTLSTSTLSVVLCVVPAIELSRQTTCKKSKHDSFHFFSLINRLYSTSERAYSFKPDASTPDPFSVFFILLHYHSPLVLKPFSRRRRKPKRRKGNLSITGLLVGINVPNDVIRQTVYAVSRSLCHFRESFRLGLILKGVAGKVDACCCFGQFLLLFKSLSSLRVIDDRR